MNIKNIIALAGCLIVAMPSESFAVGNEQENEQNSITETQAGTLSSLVGAVVAVGTTLAVYQIPHARSLSAITLSDSGLVSGMIGGAIGLKAGQIVYGWIKPNRAPNRAYARLG